MFKTNELLWDIVSHWGRSSLSEVFLGKDMKTCGKFTGEHPCQSVISVESLCNFMEIAFRHGYSTVNLLNIFRATFSQNTPEGLFWFCKECSMLFYFKFLKTWNHQYFFDTILFNKICWGISRKQSFRHTLKQTFLKRRQNKYFIKLLLFEKYLIVLECIFLP